MSKQFQCAAIVYGPGDDVDAALTEVVEALQRTGRTVAGLLQRFGETVAAGKREMLLRILPGEDTIRLNDPRGSGVQGCILDTDALARAAMLFREAALSAPDLLLASRFGKQEAAGSGMRAELADVLQSSTPLLVPMRNDMLPAWSAFLGAPVEVLAPDADAILAWANRNCPVRTVRTGKKAVGRGTAG
jgi:molybdate transport system ATP-binding protein